MLPKPRYELPEQHEPLLVLLPPTNAECHAGLAKDFCDRRASGATSFLIADRDLFHAAQEQHLLETGRPSKKGELRIVVMSVNVANPS